MRIFDKNYVRNMHGCTEIIIKNINGSTKATTIRNQKPIKILNPKSHPKNCHLVTTNYGGGIVQGDTISINILSNRNTTCLLSSQANNRVYKNDKNKSCSIHQKIELKENVCFIQLNDPLVLQKNSDLKQALKCNMPKNSIFILLDWVSSGRILSNESAEFRNFNSLTEVYYDGRKILFDKFFLNPHKTNCLSPASLFNHTTFINLYLIGESKKIAMIFAQCEKTLKTWLNKETKAKPRFVASLDTINPNLHILRSSATETEILWEFVKEISRVFDNKELLSFNPYDRKY